MHCSRFVGPILGITCAIAASAAAVTPVDTVLADFFLNGTQPNSLTNNIATHTSCSSCHNLRNSPTVADGFITRHWQGSIMAQAGRDPLFYACLDIANAVAPGSGDLCIRCHMPKGWLEGRSTPTSGALLTAADRDGVTCNFCHRIVDPAHGPGEPAGDAAILAALVDGPPSAPGNGSYVVDPTDVRRGPFSDAQCGSFHAFAYSPLFSKSALCGTCHDVSNPAFVRSGNDYVFTADHARHPTGNKYDMRQVERTYSEWLNSAYAVPPGIDSMGRFGGPGQQYVSTCQDCHLPDTTAPGCSQPVAPVRTDMPQHMLNGAANWVLDAIVMKYGPTGTNELTSTQVTAIGEAKSRNLDMLQRAATLQAALDGGYAQLKARVINETGHKLPSGYPEGRRVWLNVEFRDCAGALIAERGHYDAPTASLTTGDTKVYESQGGVDAAVAGATGLPVGHSFFFVLNNVTLKDNRIPPRGFANAAFAAVQADPVAYSYADGQYWDDTFFAVPAYAVTARVRLYYQSSSKDYIEFLRDNNPFAAPNHGTELHDLWAANGQGGPILMADSGDVNVRLRGDLSGDRTISVADIPPFIDVLLGRDADANHLCAADLNGDGQTDGRDVEPMCDALY